MLNVGLTGGIGAGKSEVSARLAALGAVIIDADAVAREVVAPGTPGLAKVVEIFGPGILAADGSLDRPRLGEIVFADPGSLAKLNAVIHPLVAIRSLELQRHAPANSVVIHDVPLLAENKLADRYDVVVVVDAPPEVQLGRLTRLRGMPAGQARARMAAQASRADRLAVADFVVDNSADLAELDRQVTKLWAELTRLAG
ncbi:MAG TPA: dephospho-CoA kinase [Streptosporangiaceae bacterium]|nr:dephospho-CoA kinase [Streptosporangiaceae bacterium]